MPPGAAWGWVPGYGARRIRLEAQSYAQGFYEKAGFARCSDEFDEDGIPHVEMVLDL